MTSVPKRNYSIFVIILLILLDYSYLHISDAETLVKEYQVKAVFWYNFTKFIVWPPSAFTNGQTSLYMCILGDDPFQGEMELAVKGLTSQDRLIQVKYLSTLNGVKDCHTIFISHSEKEQLSKVLNELSEFRILTVSDIKDFTKLGGMIEFYHEDNKIRFMIELDVLSKAGLRAHAQLLKISKIVQRSQ